MADEENKEQYQTRYGTYRGDGSETDLIVDNLDAGGQITAIRIYSDSTNNFSITTGTLENDANALPFAGTPKVEGDGTPEVQGSQPAITEATPIPRVSLVGQDVYEIGSFENPVLELSSRSQFRITNQAPSGTIAVNVVVDERLG